MKNLFIQKILEGHTARSKASLMVSALFILCFFMPVLKFGFIVATGSVSLAFLMQGGSPFLIFAFLAGITSIGLSLFKRDRFVFIPAFISFVGVFLSIGAFIFMASTRDAVIMPVALLLMLLPIANSVLSFMSFRNHAKTRRFRKAEMTS